MARDGGTHDAAHDDGARSGWLEDAPPVPRAALLHAAPASGSRRSQRAVAAPLRPDRCQVPDCASPSLAHLRPYNRRTRCVAELAARNQGSCTDVRPRRLCETHQLADSVRLADGSTARLCQRCHRLHPLSAFSGSKHSCREALAALAAATSRRRAARAAHSPQHVAPVSAAASPADGSDSSTAALAPEHACDDVVAWLSASVAPAGAPAAAAAAAAASPDAAPALSVIARLKSSPGANLAAAAAALALHGFALHIKLPHCASPAQLPPPAALRGALGAALPDAAAPPSVALLPGCVRLLLDALLPSYTEVPSDAQAAAHVAAALRGSGLASHPAARGATVTVGGARCLLETPGPVETLPADDAPAFWLAPQAALSGVAGDDTVPLLPYDVQPSPALAARCGGHHVRLVAAGAPRLRLHRGDVAAAAPAGGALLLMPAAAARSDAARVVLLCGDDAALADEVNTACALLGLQQRNSATNGTDDDANMQRVLLVLGAALQPRAPLRVRQAAGAAAVWLGWAAAAAALVRVSQAEHPSSLADEPHPGDECDAVTALALHMAAHASEARSAGCLRAADAVMAALATSPGAPQPAVAAAAWRLAGAALQRAGDAGHAEAGCAVAAALRDVQSAADVAPEVRAYARRVLHGVRRLVLERAALTDTDEDEGGDDDAAGAHQATPGDDEDAAYDTYLLLQNRTLFNLSGLLGGLGAASTALNLQRFVLRPPAWPPLGAGGTAGALVERVRLYPTSAAVFGGAGGPAYGARDAVPWAVVQSHAALLRRFTLAVHLPMAAALMALSLRLTAQRARGWQGSPRLFAALHACESLAALACDALVLHATRAAPLYPTAPLAVRALGTWFVCVRGPYRPLLVWAVLAAQLLGVFGVPAAAGRLPAMLRDSPAHVALAAVLIRCAVTVRGRDRRMRAEFAAMRAAEREASSRKIQ